MNLLITGYFNEYAKQNIIKLFPKEWVINIVEPKEINKYIENAIVLIPEHIQVDCNLIDKAHSLKLVQTGAGYDNVDIESCTNKNIWVCNSAGVNANAVAEHIWAMLLSYYKNIHFLDAFMKNNYDEKALDYVGSELEGKTIGIIGFGAIGSRVAKFAQSFDMNILAYDINPNQQNENVEFVDLDSLIQQSDVITMNIFLNEQTRNFINKSFLSKMKPNSVLINTSRGGIICEQDLIEALKEGKIGGACLDVFCEEPLNEKSELRLLKNVVLTPHTAGMPDGAKFHKKRYNFFLNNINKVISGLTPASNINQISQQ